jgi:hypothetical protein
MVLKSCIFVLLFTASVFSNTNEQHSVGLEKMAKLLRGDVRLISMGDSYSSPYFARVPLASLRVWPIHNIAALSGGATLNSHLITCTAQCNPVSDIRAEDALGYAVERNTSKTFFTLPILGMQEIYTSPSFDDENTDQLFTIGLNNFGDAYMSNGVHGKFAESESNVRFRFLYRCPTKSEQMIDSIKILDEMQEVGVVQLQDDARPFWHLGENPLTDTRQAIPRQINASSEDFPALNNTEGYLRIRLEQIGSLQGTNQYFEPAGGVYYHLDSKGERETGLYFSYVADASWSYSGFGCDTEGSASFDKRFSLEQFTHWLDVTTLDRNQPIVFMWFLAPEQLSYNTSFNRMTDMIEQANTSAKLVGITSVDHLIIIGSLFNLTNDVELTKVYIRNQQEAAFDLASTRSDVAAASLFSATDEVFFNGTGGVPWLLYHGFDHFEFGSNSIDLIEETGGDLFDVWNIHPSSPNSAAFFSALLGEMIREAGCKADVLADGYININDFLKVVSRFGQENVHEDINEDGIVDIRDLLLVIDGWGECWPVQAPFNTSTFRNLR